MGLYGIIKALQNTTSTNNKLCILEANKDNMLLKEYLRLTVSPDISFSITEKTFPVVTKTGTHTFQSLSAAGYSLGTKELSQRHVTGQAAKNFIIATMEDLDEEHQELFKMLLLKDIRAKVGVTLVNKVWPNLCVDVPYMRCSLPDEKTLKKFNNGDTFIVQTKCDGSFATLVMENEACNVSLYTRNGNSYPKHVVEHLLQGSYNWEGARKGANHALEGELLCFRNGEMLSRKEGNGLLNSLMQGAEIPEDITLKHILWNYLPIKDWKSGKTDREYGNCFTALYGELEMCLSSEHFEIVDHRFVDSLQEAYKFNQEQLAKGLEGSIIKTLSHKWKNGTSKECLKLKIEAEIDLVCIGYTSGSGKNKETFGSLTCESSCGNLAVDVSGFSDRDRKDIFENFESYKGAILTVLCNDLITNKDSGVVSLFLPRFVEWRLFEKQEPDNLERIIEIFKAKRYGS